MPKFNPPQPFDGNATNWPIWRQKFKRYAQVSDLKNADKVPTFLLSMGDVADNILITLNIDEDTVTFDNLLQAFDNYFKQRKNVIIARALFNKRSQKTGEPIDTFIQDIHRLADDCEYGQLKEELIRDRIVVGVVDDDLSNDLQSRPKLTLSQAIELSRQAETRKQSQSLLRDNTSLSSDVAQLGARAKSRDFKHRPPRPVHNPQPQRQGNLHTPKTTQCQYCGYDSHPRPSCPAKAEKCSGCGKIGHYKSVCRSSQQRRKEVHTVQDDMEDEYDFDASSFQMCINSVLPDKNDDEWNEKLLINEKHMTFQLDTGAKVTVIGEKDFKSFDNTPTLVPSKRSLTGAGNSPLKILGAFKAEITYKNESVLETVYVIKDQPFPLLSRSACKALKLVSRLHSITPQPSMITEQYPQLFSGKIGQMEEIYDIQIDEIANPHCLYTPRKIPHALKTQVKDQLDEMLEKDIIFPVTEPSDWCAGMVVVPKPKGRGVRICVDFTELNKSVKREAHPLHSVDESLAKLAGSKVFSKVDATSGFWQIKLSEKSKKLTCFITPFGRFAFNRLPFGISSASEIFQRTMSKVLDGVDGVICHMDDVLVHSPDDQSHTKILTKVLDKLQAAGLTLNEKCEFYKHSISFLGHVIDSTGIRPDPHKLSGIQNFPPPTNVTELQRFLGMVNQLTKFSRNLATQTLPLRQLLRKNMLWTWGPHQDEAFNKIKNALTSTPVLAHYDVNKPTIVATDASCSGLGAVLYQLHGDKRRPVCFISRSLTDAEKNYATIEKEALAVSWACERLAEYVLGMDFLVETDHKPLVPLLSTTEIAKMPPRIQRFRLRLTRFSPKISHVPGKNQVTADALSRAPANAPSEADVEKQTLMAIMEKHIIDILPATSARLDVIRKAQEKDDETAQIKVYCSTGWPAFPPQNTLLKQFWSEQQHFSVVDDLLMYDTRIVIPRELRAEMMNRLHEGHQGITKCRALARTCMWWPTLNAQIEDTVKTCTVCAKHRPEPVSPLLPSSTPDRPWSRLGMDLFELDTKTYLLVVDYLSRWIEIRQLRALTSNAVVSAIKDIFSIHGIPDLVISDNGPQFSSQEFRTFAQNYEFHHTTSSPRYPQSNGEAERAVQTVKKLLKKSPDPQLALLQYRATPLANGFSPAEILMGRKLQTKLPLLPLSLKPETPDFCALSTRESLLKERQQQNFNRRHAAKEQAPFNCGDPVFIRDLQRSGTVINKHHNPRSYIVETDKGQIRRNGKHLIPTPGVTPIPSPIPLPLHTPIHASASPSRLPLPVRPPTPTSPVITPTWPTSAPEPATSTASSSTPFRSSRTRSTPKKFNDYVMGKP
jgi:hypothetical protein